MRTVEQDASRLLVVIYGLAGGREGAAVKTRDVYAEAARVGLFEMSEEAFEGYRAGTLFRVKERRS